MFSSRLAVEWRDDLPRTFSLPDTPPHRPQVRARRRALSTALLIPRLVAAMHRH